GEARGGLTPCPPLQRRWRGGTNAPGWGFGRLLFRGEGPSDPLSLWERGRGRAVGRRGRFGGLSQRRSVARAGRQRCLLPGRRGGGGISLRRGTAVPCPVLARLRSPRLLRRGLGCRADQAFENVADLRGKAGAGGYRGLLLDRSPSRGGSLARSRLSGSFLRPR